MRRPSLRAVLTWSGFFVSIAFAYLAIRNVDLSTLRLALEQANYWWLAPAALLLTLAIFLRAIRWRLLFSPERRPTLGVVANALLIGYLFTSILPARAGEVARVLALNQRAGTSRFEAFGTVIAERALDVLALLLFFFLVAPVFPRVDWLPQALWTGALLFAVLAALLTVFALRGERPARLLLRPLAVLPGISPDRTRLAAANLVHGFAFFRRPATALAACALTALSWLLIAFAFWLCMLGFHLGLGFAAGVAVVVAVNLAIIIPSGPAAVGVFEAATLVALFPFEVDHSTALSYAVVLHALNVLPFILVGYVAFHRHTLAVRRASEHRRAVASGTTEALHPHI